MFIKNIHVSLWSINLCLENSPGKKCIWKRFCQIHQIRWIKYKYKYKYMVWNLIKYKYKYKYAVFVFVFVFANTNTYLTPALSRTSTGWRIEVDRLLDVLKFKYPFITSEMVVRLTGDGREFGGRHSTFVALNVLNDELLEHGVPHQSPKECFPVALFYEGDSRDNLEQNLTVPTNDINQFLATAKAKSQYDVYLAADEMFTEACLDSNGVLSPKSATDWNIYATNDIHQKDEVADSGLRTDLPPLFTRSHPDSILSEIDIKKIVFCVLHGGARVVEKMLNVELERIVCDPNRVAESGAGPNLTAEDLVRNLENNIRACGVKSGSFKIEINEKTKKAEPVKLNKDDAFTIIFPSSPDDSEHPHVLSNVLSSTSQYPLQLPQSVLQHLDLPATLSDFELVSLIWSSFHYMFSLLKSEPNIPSDPDDPSLHDVQMNTDCNEVSEGTAATKIPQWHYTEEQKTLYKFHAERFYQLYKYRYKYPNLTPYMMKFIDYAPYFMSNLPVPLNRFQTEGSEHMNYDHTCYYFSHTTRHGGLNSTEPLKALFLNMWRHICICYQVEFKSDNEIASSAFLQYCEQNVAVLTISRHVRGWLLRKKLVKHGGYMAPATIPEKLENLKIAAKILDSEPLVSADIAAKDAAMFAGISFILCGTVPKTKAKKMTQGKVEQLIVDNGGRVRKAVPGAVKGRSTKRYIILFEKPKTNKVPALVKSAIARGYQIASYGYLFDSISCGERKNPEHYHVDLADYAKKISVQVPLHRFHFAKKKKMLSCRKREHKLLLRKLAKKKSKVPKIVNIAVFYALRKRSQLRKPNMTFKETNLGPYMRQWKEMPSGAIERKVTRKLYNVYCENIKRSQNVRQKLLSSGIFSSLSC